MNIVRESALKVDWEKNPLPHRGLEPASVWRLAFQSDVLPTELFPPSEACLIIILLCSNFDCHASFLTSQEKYLVLWCPQDKRCVATNARTHSMTCGHPTPAASLTSRPFLSPSV